jgi:hypothetical protein
MSDQLDKFSKELATFSQSLDGLRKSRGELRTSLQVGECFERLGSIIEMFVGDILQAKAAEQKITLDIRGDVSRITLGENDMLVVKVKMPTQVSSETSTQIQQAVAEGFGVETRRIVVVSLTPGHDMEFGVVRECQS